MKEQSIALVLEAVDREEKMGGIMLRNCLLLILFLGICLVKVKRKITLNIIFWSIIVIQLLIIFYEAYFFALDTAGQMWGSLGAMPGMMLAIPISCLAIVCIIKLLLERFRLKAVCLVITTILAFPFMPTAKFISPLMVPFASLVLDREFEQDSARLEARQRKDYESLKKIFSTPQKVAKIKDNLLLLENKRILEVRVYNLAMEKIEKFLLDETLGKEIMVDLGNFESFKQFYLPGGVKSTVLDLLGIKYDRNTMDNEFLWTIPVVDISVEGTSLLKNKIKKQFK